MDEACDICGHNGEAELLETCTKCKISCEHVYCMRILSGEIPGCWVCESCLEGDKVTGKAVVPSIYQGTHSKFRWQKTAQSGKVKFIPSEEVIKLTAGAPDKSKITVAQRTQVRAKALTSLYSSSRKVNPSVDQANVSKNARNKTTCQQPSRASMSCEGRANVKHKYSDYEDRDLRDVLPKIHEYRAFLPALHVVWEGRFVFRETVTTGECYGGFQAQPPCRVHRKAYEASKRLPPVLEVELLSESLFKANLFVDGSLHLHDVALYFSPSEHIERLKQKNSSVIDQLEIHKSIMRSYFNGVELLIFASKHLHHDSQKIITKLIGDRLLLGVFRPTKNDKVESRERKAVVSPAGRSQISDTKAKIEAVDKKATKVNKDEVESRERRVVVSPAGCSQISDTKAKIEAVEKKATKVNKDEVESRERRVVVSPAGCSQISDTKAKIEAVDKKATKVNTDEVESRERKTVVSPAGRSQISVTKAKIEAVDKEAAKINKDEVEFQKCSAVVSPAGQSQICETKAKFEAIDMKVDKKQTGNKSLISRLDAAINEEKLKSKLQELKERDKSPLVAKKIKEETENELPLNSNSSSNAQNKMVCPPGFEKRRG